MAYTWYIILQSRYADAFAGFQVTTQIQIKCPTPVQTRHFACIQIPDGDLCLWVLPLLETPSFHSYHQHLLFLIAIVHSVAQQECCK